MPLVLKPLPYAADALEPSIDKTTMEIHHDRHHKAYVDNYNNATKGTPIESTPIEQVLSTPDLSNVPEAIRMVVRNNGGGHFNHEFFFESLTPGGSKTPVGTLAAAIDATFGSFDTFKTQFKDAALKRFGSGWAWLVKKDGKLAVVSLPNQDAPIMTGHVPIVGVDVWEHAYYLKYQNKRADYVDAFLNVVNWTRAEALFNAAK